MGNRFTNLCLGIRCGQGLETRLLGSAVEGSMHCCSSQPTLVEVAGATPWTHHRRVKRAYHADPEDAEGTTQRTPLIGFPWDTKVILKKEKRGGSIINCCYKDLLVSSRD